MHNLKLEIKFISLGQGADLKATFKHRGHKAFHYDGVRLSLIKKPKLVVA